MASCRSCIPYKIGAVDTDPIADSAHGDVATIGGLAVQAAAVRGVIAETRAFGTRSPDHPAATGRVIRRLWRAALAQSPNGCARFDF
jgi:hypothetical protein